MGIQSPSCSVTGRWTFRCRIPQTNKPKHDARRAETALAASGRAEGLGPGVNFLIGQAFERGDDPTSHPSKRRHAGHPGLPIDQHSATATLSLWTASVLDGPTTQRTSQDVKQSATVIIYLDLNTVNDESNDFASLHQKHVSIR
tara:strand:- start:143 stop:574 length:432 start_codon:yes stop_codon:yes gene_type:complete